MKNPRAGAIAIMAVGLFVILASFALSQVADPDQTGGRLGLPAGVLAPAAGVAGAAFVIGGVVMLVVRRRS